MAIGFLPYSSINSNTITESAKLSLCRSIIGVYRIALEMQAFNSQFSTYLTSPWKRSWSKTWILISSVLTSVSHEYRYSNTIREYLNWPNILNYSNIRVFAEYYSNSMCNVTCSTKMYAKALLSEFSTSLAVNIIINIIINIISIINITVIFISLINTNTKMSDSSLSLPLMSKLSLLILLPVPLFL